jgi:ABC-type phosphonate transport system ATPase subunit
MQHSVSWNNAIIANAWRTRPTPAPLGDDVSAQPPLVQLTSGVNVAEVRLSMTVVTTDFAVGQVRFYRNLA